MKEIALHPRFTPLQGTLLDWLRLFCRESFLAEFSEDAEEILKEIQDVCAVDFRDESGKWSLMYMRLRFVAVLDS